MQVTPCAVGTGPSAAFQPITLVIESVDRQELYEIAPACRFVLLGRAADCDLQLDHPDVSRRHALLVRWRDGLYFIDLGSRTGTRVGSAGRSFGWVTHTEVATLGPFRLWRSDADAPAVSGSRIPEVPALHVTVCAPESVGDTSLEFLTAGITPSIYRLKRPLTLVGRAPLCKVQLRLPTVSWVHAALLATPDGVQVKDLSTRGGLTINGVTTNTGLVPPAAELGLADVRIRIHCEPSARHDWQTETDDTLAMNTEFLAPASPTSRHPSAAEPLEVAGDEAQSAEDPAPSDTDPNLSEGPISQQFPLGRRIGGRYRLIAPLARGGMGVVFKGQDILLQRPVAIKLVRNPGSKGEAARQRLLREATLCAQLDHPHIVHVIDVDRRGRFAVFEFVDGESLYRRMHGSVPVAPCDALRWTADIAEALAYLSTQGVVHRDIKPANILITTSGAAKLIDFGLARQQTQSPSGQSRGVDAAQCLIRSGVAVGSIMFIPPEQLLDSATVDTRGDLYSLGCTLYTLLAGHPPFGGDTTEEVMQQHFDTIPPPIAGVSSEVMKVVLRALQKDPQDRYQSAAQLAADLCSLHAAELAERALRA